MVAHIETVAFHGVEAISVDVQVVAMPGKVSINIVGLADKAIAESKERVQAAIHATNLSMPVKKITINLAPADLPKEGSHYDLPIAIGLLISMEVLPKDITERYIFLGELSLDGSILPVQGVLSAALYAKMSNKSLVCPYECAAEASWLDDELEVLAPRNLLELINYFMGRQDLQIPPPVQFEVQNNHLDMHDIKGQLVAKRALEIAASGGHNLLLVGPPGSGKSMLAQRLPTILPPLDPQELLEVSLISSISGESKAGTFRMQRPFRNPHHSASMAALIGGGHKAKPGELSLAHNGVLFLDEFPEFSPKVLDSLRQPLESKECVVSRANYHIRYPARIQLIAAMNPCRCGMSGEPNHVCARGPKCQIEYQSRISGPMFDRFDLRLNIPSVSITDLLDTHECEKSEDILKRVIDARSIQLSRFQSFGLKFIRLNAECPDSYIDQIASLNKDAHNLLKRLSEKKHLSARSYRRLLKVSRTIADMEKSEIILSDHIAEAMSYRVDFQEKI